MNHENKILIAIRAILIILAFFAWHSISLLSKNKATIDAALLPSPTQTAADPVVTEVAPLSTGSHPVDYLPTTEEIQLSIEDHTQKQAAMKKLMATRDEKAEKVIAQARAASASDASQEAVTKDAPKFSPEERTEHNKELRDGIKAHIYFPR